VKKEKKMSDVEHTRRAYYRELNKIMENADVIRGCLSINVHSTVLLRFFACKAAASNACS